MSRPQTTESIATRIDRIREGIQAAARRVGRNPTEIRLVAATKTVPPSGLLQAYEAGIRIFGENRLQEAQEKMDHIGSQEGLAWHFIGRMQSRKLKAIVGKFSLLHSVESLEQAQTVNTLAEKQGLQQPILLQVNLADEGSKGGFSVSDLKIGMSRLDQMPHLSIQGLMTLPPLTTDPEEARPFFAELSGLKTYFNNTTWRRVRLEELSMGMSQDYEVAVEEGATMVRIGSGIFGPRE